MGSRRYAAVLMLFITAGAWGGMFHVAKAVLPVIDAFWLAVVRYGLTVLFFSLLLVFREGLGALKFEGQGFAAWWYGTLGFAMFNYLVFFGLNYSRPEHGAVIMALMPLIAALINWISLKQRPTVASLITMAVAFAGVLLVITHGDFVTLFNGDSAFGDLLIMAGSVSWVLYTRSVSRFANWSVLRFTTLTMLAGTSSILVITGSLTLLNIAHAPGMVQMEGLAWYIVYIIVLATIVAVLFWNQGIRMLGAINGILFINLVPVSAFIIGIASGYHPYPLELIGAALTLTALVTNNVLQRGKFAAATA